MVAVRKFEHFPGWRDIPLSGIHFSVIDVFRWNVKLRNKMCLFIIKFN